MEQKQKKMTQNQILELVKKEMLSVEDALQKLSEIGYCPALLNDDAGRWAVVFDGFQSVVMGDEPEEVQTSFCVAAECWNPNIRKALIKALRG